MTEQEKLQDRRLTPVRGDIAAMHLRGKVEAERFVEPVQYQVSAPVADIQAAPRDDAQLTSQAMKGDIVSLYDLTSTPGWAWGQCEQDGYVGWFRTNTLADTIFAPTHQVCVLRTIVFPEPDLKTPPICMLSMTAGATVIEEQGRFSRLADGGWVHSAHLKTPADCEGDFVSAAECFTHAPYLWGGKHSLGLDCSGLIQTSMRAVGRNVLRDSDMQENTIGEPVAFDPSLSGLVRGDLVFWPGHVGVMLDSEIMLHANAHHMACRSEPLKDAAARILSQTEKPIRTIRRPDGLSR